MSTILSSWEVRPVCQDFSATDRLQLIRHWAESKIKDKLENEFNAHLSSLRWSIASSIPCIHDPTQDVIRINDLLLDTAVNNIAACVQRLKDIKHFIDLETTRLPFDHALRNFNIKLLVLRYL